MLLFTATLMTVLARKLMGGMNSAPGVFPSWRGYIVPPTAATVTSNLDVAAASISDLVDELMPDIYEGLDRRLAFEAWADAR